MRMVIAAAFALALASGAAFAQWYHYNQGYTTLNGTYVQPHYQTNPNYTTQDNWSHQGNTNPFTGQPGTRTDNSFGFGR
jgi:opacity protein-like surface antigen